jgi:hypothetical protein
MAAPAPLICIEKERLFRAFGEASLEFSRLYSARVAALSSGLEPPDIDELSDAELRKDNAKYAILMHQERHGC